MKGNPAQKDPSFEGSNYFHNTPQSLKKENLFSISKVIKIAKELGVDFGKSSPYNRLRYYTKLGLLPHMVRRRKHPHDKVTQGHYPSWVIEHLLNIQQLKNRGLSYKEITQQLKPRDLTPQNQETDYTPISEVVRIAKLKGVAFGKSDPKNRLRYYTKTGLLPHAVRMRKTLGQSSTCGYYPAWVVSRLLTIQKLKILGYSTKLILEKLNSSQDLAPQGIKTTLSLGFADPTSDKDNNSIDSNATSQNDGLQTETDNLQVVTPDKDSNSINAVSLGEGLKLDSLEAKEATISARLTVLVDSLLSNLQLTGNLSVGLITIDSLDNSINALGETLKLQSGYGATDLDIFAGKLIITPDGNLQTQGEVTARSYKVDTTNESAPTLGSATLKAGETSVVIKTIAVKDTSKIFLLSPPIGQNIGILSKQVGESFTAGLLNPLNYDIQFDWWIIDELRAVDDHE